MLVSGVRSSWETLETKSFLVRSSSRSDSCTSASTARPRSFSTASTLTVSPTAATSRRPSVRARTPSSPAASRLTTSASPASGRWMPRTRLRPSPRTTASPSSTASSITATATVHARELASRASCAELASSLSIRSLAARTSSNARRPAQEQGRVVVLLAGAGVEPRVRVRRDPGVDRVVLLLDQAPRSRRPARRTARGRSGGRAARPSRRRTAPAPAWSPLIAQPRMPASASVRSWSTPSLACRAGSMWSTRSSTERVVTKRPITPTLPTSRTRTAAVAITRATRCPTVSPIMAWRRSPCAACRPSRAGPSASPRWRRPSATTR